MSSAVLTQRIAEAAKVLNPSAPEVAQKNIVDALAEHDCDPEGDPALTMRLLDGGFVYADRFFESMEINYDDSPRNRLAWVILCGNEERKAAAHESDGEESEIVQLLKEQRPVGQWKDTELLEAYNQDCDPEVERILKKKASGAPIIVFENEDEGTVDVDASLKCLRMSRRRDRMPETMRFDGRLKRLYRVGEFPALVMFQCPFHSDVILYDGYCDRDDVDWSGVGYEAMQFARLVKNAGEHPTKHKDVVAFVEVAEEGVEVLKDEYPKIGLKFDELRREDSLPNLKQRHSGARGTADPVRASGGNRSY